MSAIRESELMVYASEGAAPETIRVQGGFAEVNEKGLTVLAEAIG
jgi:F-type H+-transporting ATPase subunit epsilon